MLVAFSAFTSICFAQPTGVITSEWNNATDDRNFSVNVLEIDGVRFASDRKIRKVTSGQHVLTLSSVLKNRVGRSVKKEFTLDVKPCVKYYLSAQYASTTNREDYEIKVRELALQGCDS